MTFVKGETTNPTGKGGFVDNPQNRGDGRPKNEQRFGYWLQFFKNLTAEEFKNYTKDRSEDEMYVAEVIALERVVNARKDLAEYKEVADRTEGRAKLTLEHQGEVVTDINVRIIKDATELAIDSSIPEELQEPKENSS